MDVCIIGCGNQGGCFAALLAMEPEVERIVLADLNVSAAENVKRLIREIPDQNARTTIVEVSAVNAKDPEDIARVAKGTQFIFNGILPFCNLSVMRGALLVGAHYMDLYAMSADLEGVPWEETIEAQLELDREFREQGLVALPSEGVSPGFVNLAAKYITDQMDEVEEIGIRSITWTEGRDLICMGPDVLSIEMSLHLEPPSYYKNGVIVPLDEELDFAEDFEFPAPAGHKRIYMESVSCVEALIRKYTDKPVGRIYHRGGIFSGRSDVHEVIYEAVQKAVMAHPGVENISIKQALAETLKPMANVDYKAMVEAGELTDGADTAAVIVFGKRNGRNIRYEMTFNSTLHEAIRHLPWIGNGAYSTVGSLPIILVRMLIHGKFKETGVLAPGMLPDPEQIFREIEAMGHPITETIEKYTCGK